MYDHSNINFKIYNFKKIIKLYTSMCYGLITTISCTFKVFEITKDFITFHLVLFHYVLCARKIFKFVLEVVVFTLNRKFCN